jgi:hypothetical protein
VDDNVFVEQSLIKKFKEKFIQRLEKGNEYFEGEFKELKCEFEEVVKICAQRPLPFTETQRATPYVESIGIVGMHTCECGYTSSLKFTLKRHQQSKAHELNMFRPAEADETGNFTCNTCNFKTSHKGHYRKHMLSNRHIHTVAKIPPTLSTTNNSSSFNMEGMVSMFSMLIKHQETAQQQNTELIKFLLADRQQNIASTPQTALQNGCFESQDNTI